MNTQTHTNCQNFLFWATFITRSWKGKGIGEELTDSLKFFQIQFGVHTLIVVWVTVDCQRIPGNFEQQNNESQICTNEWLYEQRHFRETAGVVSSTVTQASAMLSMQYAWRRPYIAEEYNSVPELYCAGNQIVASIQCFHFVVPGMKGDAKKGT